jgi:protein-S-isoprenylcysteine O-methyltransferase Ste14
MTQRFQEVLMRPTLKSMLALFVAGAVLFVLSASGQANSFWKTGPSWLGYVGWFGFLTCLLLLVASGLYMVVSRIRHRDQPSPQ